MSKVSKCVFKLTYPVTVPQGVTFSVTNFSESLFYANAPIFPEDKRGGAMYKLGIRPIMEKFLQNNYLFALERAP